METAEADKLLTGALREAMDEVYARGGEGLERLICGRDSRAVSELAAGLYRFARNRPDPWQWLDESVENSDGEEMIRRCCEILEQDAKAMLLEAASLYADAHRLCMLPDGPIHYASAIEKDMEWLEDALKLSGNDLQSALSGFTAARPGRGKCDPERCRCPYSRYRTPRRPLRKQRDTDGLRPVPPPRSGIPKTRRWPLP